MVSNVLDNFYLNRYSPPPSLSISHNLSQTPCLKDWELAGVQRRKALKSWEVWAQHWLTIWNHVNFHCLVCSSPLSNKNYIWFRIWILLVRNNSFCSTEIVEINTRVKSCVDQRNGVSRCRMNVFEGQWNRRSSNSNTVASYLSVHWWTD